MSKFNGNVQISKDLYFQLKKAAFEMELFEQAGVDNWDGVDEINWDLVDEFKQELHKKLDATESLIYMD